MLQSPRYLSGSIEFCWLWLTNSNQYAGAQPVMSNRIFFRISMIRVFFTIVIELFLTIFRSCQQYDPKNLVKSKKSKKKSVTTIHEHWSFIVDIFVITHEHAVFYYDNVILIIFDKNALSGMELFNAHRHLNAPTYLSKSQCATDLPFTPCCV